MFYGYFIWWYNEGLTELWQTCLAILRRVADFFSLSSLLKTWFSPWKNDVSVVRNAALSDQVKIWEQNIASRLIGALIRSLIILFTGLVLLSSAVVEIIILVLWLLGPLLIVILPLVAVIIVQ